MNGYEWSRYGTGVEDYLPLAALPGEEQYYENGVLEINCRNLVLNTLKALGLPDVFTAVPFELAGKGDMLLIDQPGEIDHVVIIREISSATVDGLPGWKVNGFGSQNKVDDINFSNNEFYTTGVRLGFYIDEDGIEKPGTWKYTAIRPQISFPPNPPKQKPIKGPVKGTVSIIRDPLLMDLDDAGIRTVDTQSGMHFDLHGDGFKEITAWVARGDGMLVLDANGNGQLDHGGELFGDATHLPNGRAAAAGFEALAQYDSNADGKIDAEDPIWSQLGVWRYADIPLIGGG
jgi:hypothetical protein